MTVRTAVVAPAVLVLALTASACGESDEEKAQKRVCDARAGISTEVDKLGALTPSTVTADAIRGSVESIRGELKEIGEARADVSDDRRADLKAANTAFTATIREVGANVLRSTSAEDAKAQLKTAADDLAASYRSTLGRYDCG
jgi:hypothetical protein